MCLITKCYRTKGRDEKGCLLLTEKKSAVNVNRRKVQPALFNCSTLTVDGTFHGQNGTFYDQLYSNKCSQEHLKNHFFQASLATFFTIQLVMKSAVDVDIDVDYPALFYLVDSRHSSTMSTSILQPFSSRPYKMLS